MQDQLSRFNGRAQKINFDLVRFGAILLITNSHMHLLYSEPRLATGGGLGNAVFFALSGYGLAASWRESAPKSYFSWLVQRLTRLYLPMWLLLFTLCVIEQPHLDAKGVWDMLVWPTPYWFIAAISTFYIVFPLILRHGNKSIVRALCLVALIYSLWYFFALDLSRFSIENDYFRWCYYFGVMLAGAWFGFCGGKALLYSLISKPRTCAAGALLTLAMYFGYKYAFTLGHARHFQWLAHALTLMFVVLFAGALGAKEPLKFNYWRSIISKMSAMSLEIYLVQVFLLRAAWLKALPHAVSSLTAWVLIFALAYALHSFSGRLIAILPWTKHRDRPSAAR